MILLIKKERKKIKNNYWITRLLIQFSTKTWRTYTDNKWLTNLLGNHLNNYWYVYNIFKRKYKTKIILSKKRYGKNDVYFLKSIMNPLLKSLKLMYILGFFVFLKTRHDSIFLWFPFNFGGLIFILGSNNPNLDQSRSIIFILNWLYSVRHGWFYLN
jgi:hypothetical protein